MSKFSKKHKFFDKKRGVDGGAERRGDAALGRVTKNSSRIDSKGIFLAVEDGLAQAVKRVNDEFVPTPTPQEARANRWALKSVVNDIMPSSRTEKCMRLRSPMPGKALADIQIRIQTEHCKAFYNGLMACGSVWICPLCAAKISERRRNELKEALDVARDKGFSIHFITLTNPHGIGDDLTQMRTQQKKALNKMSSGRNSTKSQLESMGITVHGYIRATEITHGKNGWHPHFHIILFTSPCDSSTVQSIYAPKWQQSCESSGLPRPSDAHGCTVQDGTKAAEYASKWGLEDEMTKANTKQTRKKGKSPFGLLKAILDEDDNDYPPERATTLFRIYAKSMKGSRQLHWSVNLRKLLVPSVPELTDEELAAAITDEPNILLTTISFESWKLVRRVKQEADLLSAAEASYKNKINLIAPILENLHKKFKVEGGRPVHTYTRTHSNSNKLG